MARKKRKKRRKKRKVSRPEVSPEQIDAISRRNMLPVGGVTGLALGMLVGFNLYQTEEPLLAIGLGALVAAVTWFGFWLNYGRRKRG